MPTTRPITSREYKLMLRPADWAERGPAAASLWARVEDLLADLNAEVLEVQTAEKLRWTRYLDTPDGAVRAARYSVRVRREDAGKRPHRVTAKKRSRDRYVGSAAPVDSPAKRAETKFEEDLLPEPRSDGRNEFTSRFSRSTTVRRKSPARVEHVGDLGLLFPGLVAPLGTPATPLRVVGDRVYREAVRWLGRFSFGGDPAADVRACVSAWYDDEAATGLPLVAEFSFDYDGALLDDAPAERFSEETASGALRLFGALQGWDDVFDLGGTTKTAFAYGDRA